MLSKHKRSRDMPQAAGRGLGSGLQRRSPAGSGAPSLKMLCHEGPPVRWGRHSPVCGSSQTHWGHMTSAQEVTDISSLSRCDRSDPVLGVFIQHQSLRFIALDLTILFSIKPKVPPTPWLARPPYCGPHLLQVLAYNLLSPTTLVSWLLPGSFGPNPALGPLSGPCLPAWNLFSLDIHRP